jgi:hypothetical protein
MIATLSLLLLAGPDPGELVLALRSDNAGTRLAAVRQVERLGADGAPDERFLVPLAALLRDPDLPTRGLAALALSRHVVACKGRVPDGVVVPLLLALGDENTHVAGYSRQSFVSLGERTWPQVRAALEADQPRAQRLAALEGCRRLLAIPALREPIAGRYWSLLADTDGGIRERTVVLLKLGQGEGALQPLRDGNRLAVLLRSQDRRVSDFAAGQLAALEEAAFPTLVGLLDAPEPGARKEASRLLIRLLDRGTVLDLERLIPLFERLARKEDPETDPLRAWVARVSFVVLKALATKLLDSFGWVGPEAFSLAGEMAGKALAALNPPLEKMP